MAHSNRLTKRYLEDLSNNKDELYVQGMEPLLRYIDANAPLSKRFGYSISPKQDAVRLGQTPLLHFHSSAFTGVSFDKVNGNYKLKNGYWGLFGINGPLPTHLTEYVIERKHRFKDSTLTEFLDIFHHRFLSLFYRAWADSQPTASHDRADSDTFMRRISVFSGAAGEQTETFGKKSNIQPYLAGLFSQKNRSGSTLAQILSEYIKQNVSINEFEGAWYELQPTERSQLGHANTSLGVDSIAGLKTFQRSFNFSIEIGPLCYQDYYALVSNKARFSNLKSLVIKTVGSEYCFTIKLVLKPHQTQASYLGQCKLGINSWCRPKVAEHLQPDACVVFEQAC